MGGIGRSLLQCLADPLLHLLVADPPWCPGPRLIEQTVQTKAGEAGPPLADRLPCDPSSAAVARLLLPSAQARTIRDRSARAWEVLRRRDHCRSNRLSSSDNTNGTVGRPEAMPVIVAIIAIAICRRICDSGR